jgi:spore maturation protein CgeB
MGHEVHFFERDTPYYASHRDLTSLPSATIHLYSDWDSIRAEATDELSHADVGMVTSYCQDGKEASELVLQSRVWRKVFYDMDTPVTLNQLDKGETVPYLPSGGLAGFDIVLSYTGGLALGRLCDVLGAKRAAALYGWVDPEIYYRVPAAPKFASKLSYLGTYAADRQQALRDLFVRPAESLSSYQFLIGGAMYPDTQLWPKNIRFVDHVSPAISSDPDHLERIGSRAKARALSCHTAGLRAKRLVELLDLLPDESTAISESIELTAGRA